MSGSAKCPNCQAPVFGADLGGLCPECVVRAAGLWLEAEAAASGGGRRFARYELLGEIARGGMGVVYRARQVGLDRTVALKMILGGHLAAPEDVRRFQAEAQAAAGLRHPNIVAIHEVGEHEGQHYFSMDYIEGRSLAMAARERPFTPGQAARCVQAIAGAVQYAHEHGVLHRDLKPSNVLLDAAEQPHVTDFGLARRIEGGGELTLTGQVLGTPGYMAPEQAAGQGERLGPATDVYGLGAILYELLTGRPPFGAATVHETIQQVLGAEPVSPRLLNPSVPRDLETICLKCLEKEPGRRYASAQALGRDLGRHLNDEPIEALPPSTVYRARKFVRRHRLGVAVAAGVSLVLVAASIVSILFGIRATLAQKREEAERIRATGAETAARRAAAAALQSQTEASAVLEFFKDRIVAAARPQGDEYGLGHDVTLRAAMEAAAEAIPQSFTNLPMVEAEVRRTLGKTFQALGDYEKAVTQFDRAVALVASVHGTNHPRTLADTGRMAIALRHAGRLSEALAQATKVVSAEREAFAKGDPDAIEGVMMLAAIQEELGDLPQALSNYQAAVRLALAELDPDDPTTLRAQGGSASLYHRQKRFEQALDLRRIVLRARERTLGATHSETLLAKANLAATLQDMGRQDEAIAVHHEMLEVLEKKFGMDHPRVLTTVHNLGVAHMNKKQYDQALPHLQRALVGRTARLGPSHQGTVMTAVQMGTCLLQLGRATDASQWLTNCLQKADAGGKIRAEDRLDLLGALISAYLSSGQLLEALAVREQALKISVQEWGPDDPRTLARMDEVAWACLYHTNRFADAEKLFRKIETAQRATEPSTNGRLATTQAQLALCLLNQRKFAEAEPVLREAIPTFVRIQPNRSSTFTVFSHLGWALMGQGKYGEAEDWMLKAYDGFTARDIASLSRGGRHYLKETVRLLVELYEAWGEPGKAAQWRKKIPSEPAGSLP